MLRLLPFCIVLLVSVPAFSQDKESKKLSPGQEHLQQLKSFIGTWENTDDDGKTQSASWEWINNKSYIVFTSDDYREVIGWDLKTKSLTSWGFGTHGGQGKYKWTKDGGTWKAEVDWLDREGNEAEVWRTMKVDGNSMKTVWSYDGEKTEISSKRK